jgi:plastocyanin
MTCAKETVMAMKRYGVALTVILLSGGRLTASALPSAKQGPENDVPSNAAVPAASGPKLPGDRINGPATLDGAFAMQSAPVPTSSAAGASSADSGAAAPTILGTIRGKVKTQPAQSAQYALVYLRNGPLDSVIDAKLDDHKMTFYPYVSVMTVGGTLTYVNSEPFPDTAFSMSNEKWDFGLVESRGVRKRKFDNAGAYTILCRLHPNQLAFLVVSPSSFIARADKTGEFVMPNVPAGSYELVAWAPRVKSEQKDVTVINGESTVDFDLKR